MFKTQKEFLEYLWQNAPLQAWWRKAKWSQDLVNLYTIRR